jgi:KDO2-lipid IV(A) lauroyltransferase
MPRVLTHDSLFWRRLARFGAAHGPEWWVRYSPAFFGCAAAVAVPSARRAVLANLRRVRGRRGAFEEALDVARTFSAYAGCLAEVLSNGSKNARLPDAAVIGKQHLEEAVAPKRGVVLVTLHTAGWETVGTILAREHPIELVMAMARERNDGARRLHDEARAASGLHVTHIDGDPLASLALLHHLRRGRMVGLQLDRVPPGVRTRDVNLFAGAVRGAIRGAIRGTIPEGPLRLAAVSGAPVLPLFCARAGYRKYIIDVRRPIFLPRRPVEAELAAASQVLADEMSLFLQAHPTQWFNFGPD